VSDERAALTVEGVADASIPGLDAVDCVVVGHDADVDGFERIERVTDAAPSVPCLCFGEPAAGLLDRALAAGADDVVAAAGPDRYATLAHRIVTTVEHDRTVADLRETEARFEALTENTPFGIVTIDVDSVVQYASQGIEDVLGYEPDALVGESLLGIMPERFHEPHERAVTEYLSTGDRRLDWSWIELPAVHADGHEVPLGISFGERRGDDGHLFSAVIRDISERQDRKDRLDRLASAVEASRDGVALLDADGDYEYVNDAHADIYGFEAPEAMLGTNWRDRYGADELARFESDIMPDLREAGQWRGEATGQRADGTEFPQALSLAALDDGGIVCVVRDVTDRVERRRELESEREFTESVLDTLPDVFYVLDATGRFQRWNDRMNEVTGYTDAELDGMHATEIIVPEDHEMITEAMTSVFLDGATETRRSELLTSGGDRIPYEFNGNQLTDADGEVVGLTGIGRDVSEKELRKQRLAVLSRVLRHNVRNRMSVVDGNADYVAEFVDDPELRDRLDTISEAAMDLVELSDHARDAERMMRDRQRDRNRVDLAAVAERALDTVDPDTAVDTDLGDTAPAFAADGIETVVVELIHNALEHVADPTVRVTVERVDGRPRLTVADDGPGIPEHERQALTTESETDLDHSTGIGLWLVNWLTTASGGTVVYETDLELGGAAVTLQLPRARE
jgi:PAS domain S-box-containing protein